MIDEAVSVELLQKIVNLYITVRLFSFASSCVETCKQLYKKTFQKGRGMRKESFTTYVRHSLLAIMITRFNSYNYYRNVKLNL